MVLKQPELRAFANIYQRTGRNKKTTTIKINETSVDVKTLEKCCHYHQFSDRKIQEKAG